jgi:hypothetical protein
LPPSVNEVPVAMGVATQISKAKEDTFESQQDIFMVSTDTFLEARG